MSALNCHWERRTHQLSENERILILFALGRLASDMPDWLHELRQLASKMEGAKLFEEARILNAR